MAEDVQDVLARRLRTIMTTEDGRAWMWEHLSGCGVFESSYTPDTHDTAFNEGRRSRGLKLLSELQEHVFPSYQKMEAEARERNLIEDETDVD